jgi:hypothetical protein
MTESMIERLRPHTLRMKGHLLEAMNAGSQGGGNKVPVTQQLIDDLQEAVIVLTLVDIGKITWPTGSADRAGVPLAKD